MSKSSKFARLRRGTIFTTGESAKGYSTFVKLSVTVAVAYEKGKTVPSVQYIPTFWQECEIVDHIASGIGK